MRMDSSSNTMNYQQKRRPETPFIKSNYELSSIESCKKVNLYSPLFS